ncbi:MAG TPA: ATP-binding protein [Candidatus Krumholzibacteria bacterium]|nr:ATP-binding protein [Candidatus Krumholzibacteria bacterium]
MVPADAGKHGRSASLITTAEPTRPDAWPDGTLLWRHGAWRSLTGHAAQPPTLEEGPRVLLVDAADTDPERIAELLLGLGLRRGGHLPVLLHPDWSGARLTRVMSAGLADALILPASPADWDVLRDRLVTRLDDARARRTLSEEQRRTTDQLRERHRDLQDRLQRTGEDLAQAHAELTGHLDQLSLLYRFGRELSSARNWDATLAKLLESLARFIGAEGAALVLRPAEGRAYAPRQTWRWEESAWDRVLLHLEKEHAARGDQGDRLDLFKVPVTDPGRRDRVTALPLEHMDLSYGFLLLLGFPAEAASPERRAFLKAVQVILAEEVASAQMLDRMRELSVFNARVLETVQSGIWVVDENARTVYCNRVACELSAGRPQRLQIPAEPRPGVGRGRSEGGAASASFFRDEAFNRAEVPELFLDGLLRLDGVDSLPFVTLAGRTDGFMGEGTIQSGDASRPVLVQASAMRGRGDDEQWLVVVVEDLSESKKLAAERQRADGLQSLVEMSATLAHEIRNPLMGLSAQAELLADHLAADDPRRRYIDVITDEVERIDETIRRMLQYVRPIEARPEDVDLVRLLDDCARLAAPRADAADVRLVVNVSPSTRRWRCDPGQIKQVVLNLVFNAVDASPPGGEVRLEARPGRALEILDPATGWRRRRPGLRLTVRDHGRGFGSHDPESLFRPFVTTKTAGTGLGLSISRKIVEAHGGNVKAERLAGETLFSVLLPAPDADATGPSEQREERA